MNNENQITIYSAPWCAFCHMAKHYFDSLKIPFKEIDVDADHKAARQLVDKTGQAGIPVIEIGGKTIIGFDKPKIDAALEEFKLK